MPADIGQLILDKMDKILRLLAVLATKDMKQREQIALLDQAGLRPKDIADPLGTSGNTVRVELGAIRKRDTGVRSRRSRASRG
ncbi:MAG TPA: helix-turn-helix domain-containing protein [Candidatus Dormibacteraeota bacterium]|nr:helix-turn-helix domain-containing protein [Candidatus Dormibacteraeota bacterium]